MSLLGNRTHQLVGVLLLLVIVTAVTVIVISLCIFRRLASNSNTTQSTYKQAGKRDKMAAAHVTYETPIIDV